MHVGGAAHEGESHHIDALRDAEAQVGDILLGERGQADGDTGEVDAFVIANVAAADDFGTHLRSAETDHAQLDEAIGEEDAVAGLDVGGEVGVSGGGAPAIAGDRLGGDDKGGARFERAAAAGESAEADFGSLQIEEDAGGAAEFGGHLAMRAACSA